MQHACSAQRRVHAAVFDDLVDDVLLQHVRQAVERIDGVVLRHGCGAVFGIEESHPQPDAKRGSPLYVEFHGNRWHSDTILFGAGVYANGSFSSPIPAAMLALGYDAMLILFSFWVVKIERSET